MIKQPTPQGISRLLARAGHRRAQVTGLSWGAAGFIARQDWAGPGVRVSYFSPSGATSPEHQSAMLAKYKVTLRDAGWHVEMGMHQVLSVTAPEPDDITCGELDQDKSRD